jgi:hypothetical protein
VQAGNDPLQGGLVSPSPRKEQRRYVVRLASDGVILRRCLVDAMWQPVPQWPGAQ